MAAEVKEDVGRSFGIYIKKTQTHSFITEKILKCFHLYIREKINDKITVYY